jgi:integrase
MTRAELGLRWGECSDLQVADVEMLRRTVTIRRNLGEVKGVVIIGEPKTAAGRGRPHGREIVRSPGRRRSTLRAIDAPWSVSVADPFAPHT